MKKEGLYTLLGTLSVFSKKNNVCHHFVTYIFVTLCDKIKNRSFYD